MIPEPDIPAVVALHDTYGITAKEALTLLLFLRGTPVAPETIRDVYCDSTRAKAEEARNWAKRVRTKSRGAIKIRHERGMGYELAPETLRQVRAIVKQARAA
jgi:hypothetical protein